ncbi:MAG: hypothetical protein JOS17DRAFT_120858 [Linnemannia elongata]|nr:MAG: hypothetical protein JOS17DRAFT_120858 [Linnemannia elongata]
MISLPRSPFVKLMLAVFVVLAITAYTLSGRPSFDKDYWSFKQQQEAERDYKLRQQHQQEQYQQEQEHPRFPVEGSKERVPLSTFKVHTINHSINA